MNVRGDLVGSQRDQFLGRTSVVFNNSRGFLVIEVELTGHWILLHEERFSLVEEFLHVHE